MRYSRIRAGIVVGVAATALLAPSMPAQASVTGLAGFTCNTTLPVFPGTGTASCSGTAAGVVFGVDTAGDAYVAAGPASFNATFNYSEQCAVLTGLPVAPLQGLASGHATISGAVYLHGPGSPLTGTARLDTDFAWTRVGLTAVVTTFNTTVTLVGAHGAVSVLANPDGAAVAAFLPAVPPGNCAPGGAHATSATVVGAAVFLV